MPSGGPYAARLWWMLRWLGHDAAAVLDGGWNAWLRAPHSITKQMPEVKPARFVCHRSLVHSVTAGEIANDLGKGQRRLLDARVPNRYSGESETLDPVAGHIPGAVNRSWQLNLETEGRFKPLPS
jgi:thiosulfate/3-mercaptopyruvate sulfurtransferase